MTDDNTPTYETELDDSKGVDEIKRAQSLERDMKLFNDHFDGWVKHAKTSNTFLRGTHFDQYSQNHGTSSSTARSDFFPEDRNTDDSNNKIPSIDYTLSRINRFTQYCRADEGEPIVQSEGAYSIELVDDQAIEAVGARFSELKENEIVAKLVTARLDKFRDSSDINKTLDDVIQLAAAQRMAFTVGEWREDETTAEPFKLTVVKVGNFWFDPDANRVDECKFIGYKRRKQERSVVESKYNVDLSDFTTDKYIDVEHHYTRDYTTETRSMPTGEVTPVGTPVEETAKIYKYPRAWRYTVKYKSRILYDGEMDTPGATPPIATLPWRKLPFSMVGVSMIDSLAAINRAIDKHVDTLSKSAYRLLPKILVNTAGVENAGELDEGEAAGWVECEGKVNGDNIRYLDAGNIPSAVYTLMDKLKAEGDETCGVAGINMEDAIKSDLSGDAIEGIVQSQDGIAGNQRDAWHDYLKDIYTMAARFYMANETEQVSVTVPTPIGDLQTVVEMSRYGFNDSEFETRFDVQVFSPKNMPRNPVRKAQYIDTVYTGIADKMERFGPEFTRLYIQQAGLPNTGALLEYVNNTEQRQQEQAQMQSPDNGIQEQAAAKIAVTTQESRVRMATDTAKSTGDALEDAAKKAVDMGDFAQAAAIIDSIPAAVNNAYDQVMAGGAMPLPIEQPIPEQPEAIQ